MKTTVVLLLAYLLVSSASVAQISQQSRRVRSMGRPIAEHIRPTDERLIIEWDQPPLTVLVPPFETLLETMTDASDVVVILRVEHKESRLTAGSRRERNVPGQSWIRSVVTARVERLLKSSPKLPLSEGARVTFIEEGGALRVGQTMVEAVVPWARPFQAGTRYLVFSLVPNAEERSDLEAEWQLGAHPGASYEEVGVGGARLMQNRGPAMFDQIESIGMDGAAVLIVQHLQTSQAR